MKQYKPVEWALLVNPVFKLMPKQTFDACLQTIFAGCPSVLKIQRQDINFFRVYHHIEEQNADG